MRLTTKGRFAVTAMIDLALRQHSGPVTLATISERQNISLSYLEQLFGKLRRHKLVDSTRGPGGVTAWHGLPAISPWPILFSPLTSPLILLIVGGWEIVKLAPMVSVPSA